MLKHLSYLSLFISVLILGCTPKQEPITQIKVNLKNTGKEKMEVFNIAKGIYHELNGDMDSLQLDIKEGTLLSLAQGYTTNYVFIQPGEQLTLDTISTKPLVLGTGENASKENTYLNSFKDLLSEQSKAFSLRDIAVKEVDSFQIDIKAKYLPLANMVDEIGSDVDVAANFKEAMKMRLMATKGIDMVNYKSYYKYFNKKAPELPENFYAELETIDFKSPLLLSFNEGGSFGDSWNAKDLDYESFDNTEAYFEGVLKSAEEKFGNTLMGNLCFYNVLTNQINFGSGIDEAGPSIEKFKSKVTNKYFVQKLDQTIEPWLALKKGLDAPDFDAVNREGKPVKLSDLKGKKVYIDVWATWCGPCIKEIPSLKELEKELHEEPIEFVSVSVDDAKDKEKWLKFIEKEELKGVQLMADGAFQSDVATSYNIKGIPRFLLIDPEGKIVSANAPRPSDPKVKEALLN